MRRGGIILLFAVSCSEFCERHLVDWDPYDPATQQYLKERRERLERERQRPGTSVPQVPPPE